MSEPRALAFGQPTAVSTPALPDVAPMLVANAPAPVPAVIAPPAANLRPATPITIMEASDFGKGPALAASGIADKITGIARMGDIDEVGAAFGQLMVTAKKYDPSSIKKGGGLLGLFKVKVQEIKNRFATVDSQVDALVGEADKRISLFKQRVGDLDKLYDENEARYYELGHVVEEVDRRIAWMEVNLPAVDAADPFSTQRLADWNTAIDYAKKRNDDLRRGQTLCQLQGPQIRQMQQNSVALVTKFGEIKTTTIPVLKNAFALYILNLEQEKGADFAHAVDDLTNQTLLANSQKLGQTTVKVQTALARSNVELSTLQQVQQDTIKALADVEQIRSDMKTRLASERPQLEALSQQLAQSLNK